MNKRAPSNEWEWWQLFDSDWNEFPALLNKKNLDLRMQKYAEAMLAFHTKDIQALDQVITSMSVRDETGSIDMTLLLVIRLCSEIHRRAVEPQTLRQAENFAKRDPLWAGELSYFISAGHEVMGRLTEARAYAVRAFEQLKAAGAKRKSVRVLRKALLLDQVIHPQKNFLPDWKFLYLEAKRAGDDFYKVGALIEIAREHAKVGKETLVYKYANLAVGSYKNRNKDENFFLALVERARALVYLKKSKEAKLDIELASASESAEVHAALALLVRKFFELAPAYRPPLQGAAKKTPAHAAGTMPTKRKTKRSA